MNIELIQLEIYLRCRNRFCITGVKLAPRSQVASRPCEVPNQGTLGLLHGDHQGDTGLTSGSRKMLGEQGLLHEDAGLLGAAGPTSQLY